MKLKKYYQMKKRYNQEVGDLNAKALGIPTEEQMDNNLSVYSHLDVRTDPVYSHYKSSVRNKIIIRDVDRAIDLSRRLHQPIYLDYIVPRMPNNDIHKGIIRTAYGQNPYRLQTNAYKFLNKTFNKANRGNNSFTKILDEHQETKSKLTIQSFENHDNYFILSTEPLNPVWINTLFYNVFLKLGNVNIDCKTQELGYIQKISTKAIDEKAPKLKDYSNLNYQPETPPMIKADVEELVDYMSQSLSQLPSVKHVEQAPRQLKDEQMACHIGLLGHDLRAILNSQHGQGIRLAHKTNYKSLKKHLVRVALNHQPLSQKMKNKVRVITGVLDTLEHSPVTKRGRAKNGSKANFEPNQLKFIQNRTVKTVEAIVPSPNVCSVSFAKILLKSVYSYLVQSLVNKLTSGNLKLIKAPLPFKPRFQDYHQAYKQQITPITLLTASVDVENMVEARLLWLLKPT